MTTVAFFGSSEYSLIVLQKLLDNSDFQVSLVVTKIDKPFGRDQKVTPNAVAQFSLDHHLPLLQVEEFNENSKLKIKNCQAQLGLCVAFGPPFFDQELIDTFPLKIVNLHPSPLPKYRGATPGPWQIINGETSSAVTFFEIDALPDHGPIIAQIPFDISPTETSDSFYQKAFSLAADNLNLVLSPIRLIQDHAQKSYFPKFTKDTAKIDWTKPADYLERFVRAMQPWPIAWTEIKAKNGQVLKMKILSSTILNGKFEMKKVLIEGKKPTLWSEISQYYSLVL